MDLSFIPCNKLDFSLKVDIVFRVYSNIHLPIDNPQFKKLQNKNNFNKFRQYTLKHICLPLHLVLQLHSFIKSDKQQYNRQTDNNYIRETSSTNDFKVDRLKTAHTRKTLNEISAR